MASPGEYKPTAEVVARRKEHEARLDEKHAERAAINKANRQESAKKARQVKGSAVMYKDKNTAEKVELALTQILTQFVTEIQGKPLLEISDYSNKEMVGRRKDQLLVMKETMAAIRQLRELKDVLKDDQAAGKKENLTSADNLVLIDSARGLLKKSGLKSDLG